MSETPTSPTCPLCEGPMRLATDRVPDGMARYWMCRSSRCTGIRQMETTSPPRLMRRVDDLAAASDHYLGAPLRELMEAPVTPQGSSSGTKGRRAPKPGDRERPERRGEQAPLVGARDKTRRAEPLKGTLGGRLPKDLAEFVATCREQGQIDSAVLRDSVTAYRDRVAHGVPCPGCEYPVYPAEPRCPRCGIEVRRG